MSSRSVFQSLRELFPQVDQRILRAISIEHADDINEAVDFILSEILSSASKAPQFSCSIADDKQSRRDDYIGKLLVHDGTEGANRDEHLTVVDYKSPSALRIPHHFGEAGCSGLNSGSVDGKLEHAILCRDQLSYEGLDELKPDASTDQGEYVLNVNMPGEEDGGMLFKNQSQDDNIKEMVETLNEHAGSFFQTDQHTSFCGGEDDADTTLHSKVLCQVNAEEMTSIEVDQSTLSVVFDKNEPLEYGFEQEDDINISMNGSDELSRCSIEACSSSNVHDIESKADSLSAIMHSPILPEVNESGQICLNSEPKENKNAASYDNENIVGSLSENIEGSDKNLTALMLRDLEEDYSSLPTSLTTRSGHTLSIDVLEDSVNDVRNTKEILQSSIESVVILIKEVELAEERAKQVKEEASVAGHDILSKVEELKLIVKQVKDENDMHAGEIYGERSILGTEARELQSRLLRISEEKCRYLLITEEISRSVEERLSSAKAEICAAEAEKHEKEQHAYEALREQVMLRDDILKEYKILQQEAEENSKLREFLMDTGRSVDSLQGEIAIICEDILSLKQKVDNPIPLGKSLPSSSWSFGRSSVNSSAYRSSSSTSSTNINKEVPEKNEQAENTSNGENLLAKLAKTSLDDWVELF